MKAISSPAIRAKRFISRSAYAIGSITGLERPLAAAICYHSVGTEKGYLSVPLERCITEIQKIRDIATIVPLSDLKTNRSRYAKSTISITFDDGYKNFLTIAPFFKRNKIPVTLFVLSNPEQADRARMGNILPLLTAKDIRLLAQQGIDIGSHSQTHRDLTAISREDLRTELIESKKSLERITGKPVRHFAYPNGSYNKYVMDEARNVGYDSAWTVESGHVTKAANPFALPRIVITKNHDISEFPAVYSASVHSIRAVIRDVSSRFGSYL